MLRFALRRFYVALIGLMLLSLPLFAAMRASVHNKNVCEFAGPTEECIPPLAGMVLIRNGPLYQVWQTGLPPNGYWPTLVAVLAAEGAATAVLARRRRRVIQLRQRTGPESTIGPRRSRFE